MAWKLKKRELLERLERPVYKKPDNLDNDSLEQMSLPRVLLQLARIDADSIYATCRSVAKQLLGRVPEPELVDMDEET